MSFGCSSLSDQVWPDKLVKDLETFKAIIISIFINSSRVPYNLQHGVNLHNYIRCYFILLTRPPTRQHKENPKFSRSYIILRDGFHVHLNETSKVMCMGNVIKTKNSIYLFIYYMYFQFQMFLN